MEMVIFTTTVGPELFYFLSRDKTPVHNVDGKANMMGDGKANMM